MTEATLITPPPAPDESGYPLPGSVAQPDFAPGEREARKQKWVLPDPEVDLPVGGRGDTTDAAARL